MTIRRAKRRAATKIIRTKHRSGNSSGTSDVLVLATMSAGKSSFINALIGHELLPTANEATTACLTSVTHHKSVEYFSGICYSHSGLELAKQTGISAKQLRAWNADLEVKKIHLAGKFRTFSSSVQGLILHDTPGPNNSQEERHAQLMMEAVHTIPFKVLCYVLNASQLGAKDDQALLELLREQLVQRPKHEIVFILNKVDLLDSERGEQVTDYVRNCQAYLEAIGFKYPVIVPTMANVALYAKKALHAEPLTRMQRMRLNQALDDLKLQKQILLHATLAPEDIRQSMFNSFKRLEKTLQANIGNPKACEVIQLQQLIACSGVSTIETFIKNHRKTVASS